MSNIQSSFRITMIAIFSLALLAAPAVAATAKSDTEIMKDIRSAHTPAQHHALAGYFRGKADAAKKAAEEYRAKALKMNTNAPGGMKAHCEEIAKIQGAMAGEYEALAAMEERMGHMQGMGHTEGMEHTEGMGHMQGM